MTANRNSVRFFTNSDSLESGNILTLLQAQPIGSFREEEITYMKTFYRSNFMTNVGDTTHIYESQHNHLRNVVSYK